ncbi:unnamed protein product [Sphenostylis stenocarpa]|uniref:GH18 domain-containing protein n=1 Tax=Sphenostylis stenocarpa TaxID=92480 RepID=A0AA86VHN8_9FABA|nr:unnamed protein product [Sphenostylis stenocarpa]
MANSKRFPFLIPFLLFMLHLHVSTAEINGGHNFLFKLRSVLIFTQTVQRKNPSVKTLLSIGGGASDPSTFSTMASQPSSRKSFIDSSIQLARSNNFHGLDLDYEYPSSSSDMQNLGVLIREWRTALFSEARTSGKQVLLLALAAFINSNYYSLNYPIYTGND